MTPQPVASVVTFRLHPIGVWLVALGALLLGLLLFMAGCLTGMRIDLAPRTQETAGSSHLLDETATSSTKDRDRADATTTNRPSDPDRSADRASGL